MSWIHVVALNLGNNEEWPDRSAVIKNLNDIAPYYSDKEKQYIKAWVKEVIISPLQGRLAGVGGMYDYGMNAVLINSAPTREFVELRKIFDQKKFVLAHELAHALFDLAGKDGTSGFLIINPVQREVAQQKARNMFGRAIADMDAFLEHRGKKLKPADYSPQEQIAMLTYMYLDERFYDCFGSSIRAHVTKRGYTKADRNHETACNLRAMQACEMDVLGTGSPSIVTAIAGDIITTLEQKVDKSLRNPDRSPLPEIESDERSRGK